MGWGLGEFAGDDRFVVERRIGAGGMGVVYEAVDTRHDVRVALKTLRTISGQGLAQLKKEFRALQNVQHPNLVSLGELVESAGHWFITMELVPGASIIEHVRGPGSPGFDGERLRDAFGQLVSALRALHEAGLVHRDVKPSNVVVTAEGRVVLLDFGLVADLHGLYQSADKDVVGTVAYMAPEQAVGGGVGPAADWYALGVVLYEALCCKTPFLGAPLQVLLQKQTGTPPRPAEVAPGVPADLDALCVELLDFDPAQRPSGREIMRRLGVRDSGPGFARSSSQHTASADLLGRDAELSALAAAYQQARDGGPLAVYVRGESGLGKSVLVESFLRKTVREHDGPRPPLVLAARCYQNESVPFKALDGIVDALASELLRMSRDEAAALVPRHAGLLPRIFPTLGRVEVIARAPGERRIDLDPLELRARAIAALRELLVLAAQRRALILDIDDLHWADDDSAHLLDLLLSPPGAPGLLLIATARPGHGLPALPCPVQSIDIGPLEPAAARRLARRLLERMGCGDGVSPAEIAVEARGHPMYIDEIVRHLADAGGSPGAAPRLDQAIWDRIRRLPDEAARIVELVAVAGAPVSDECVLRASELAAGVFARRVGGLRIGHLVKAGGTPARPTLQPYHDRVRESVAANLSAEIRRQRHERLAVGLELAEHSDLEQLAHHLRESGQAARACDVYRRAAEQAADALAFARAARLYQTTLELLAADAPRRAEIEERRGDALANAGRGPESAAAYRAAMPGASGAHKLELQRRVAWQLLTSGQLDEGTRAAEELAAVVGMSLASTPRRALMRFLHLRARIRLRGLRFKPRDSSEIPPTQLAKIDTAIAVAESLGFVEIMQAACFHAEGFLMALRAGERERLARVLAGEAVFVSLAGVSAARRTRRLTDLLDQLTDEIGTPEARAVALGAKGIVAFNEGHYLDAAEQCRRAAELLREDCIGHRFEESVSLQYQSYALVLLGQFEDALEQLPPLLRDALERGDLYTYTSLQAAVGVWLPLIGDQPEVGRALVEEAVGRWSQRGFHLQHFTALTSLVNVDVYQGAFDQGHERITDGWPDVRRSMLLRVQLLRGMAWDARGRAAIAVARRRGDRTALAIARKASRVLRRESLPYARGHGLLLLAGLELERGRRDAALAALDQVTAIAAEIQDLARLRVAQIARGALIGGTDGAAMRAEAFAALRAQGVRSPERYLQVFAPWLLDSDSRD